MVVVVVVDLLGYFGELVIFCLLLIEHEECEVFYGQYVDLLYAYVGWHEDDVALFKYFCIHVNFSANARCEDDEGDQPTIIFLGAHYVW